MPECLFQIGDRQSEKKWGNGDRWAICNAMVGIDAGRGVIRHWGVSDGSARARPLRRSHSARTNRLSADVPSDSKVLSCSLPNQRLALAKVLRITKYKE